MRYGPPMRVLKVLLCATVLLGCDDDDGGGESRTQTILGLDADSAMGMSQYESNCGTDVCHGADGAGGSMAPDPAPQDLRVLLSSRTDEQVVDVLLEGIGTMPNQASRSDQELANVVAYINEAFAG